MTPFDGSPKIVGGADSYCSMRAGGSAVWGWINFGPYTTSSPHKVLYIHWPDSPNTCAPHIGTSPHGPPAHYLSFTAR